MAGRSDMSLLSYYAHQGLWGHLEHESNKMLVKGTSESNYINWWRALALGFMSIGVLNGGRLGEALRELNFLKTKHDLQLSSMVALLFFHRSARHVDHQELEVLSELVDKETERASDVGLLMSAQFHLYSGIHATDNKCACAGFELSRSLLKRVIQPDKDMRSGIQQQARVLWAWVEILLPVASRHDGGEGALQHLNTAIGDRPEAASWGFENLLVRAHYHALAQQHTDALDLLNQAVALRSWAPALLEKTKTLIALGDWDQAAETVQRVLQQNERSMDGLRLNVLIHMVRKANECATEEQLRLLIKSMERYEGSNAILFFTTARAFSRLSGRKPKILKLIVEICKKAVDLDPSMSSFLVELAHEKAMLHDYSGAMETYREAGRCDETNVAALYGTIYTHIMVGELDDAEHQVEFLVAISQSIEESPQLYFLKALLAWRHRGSTAEHLHFLEQAEHAHFDSLKEHSTASLYARFSKINPDFLIQLSKEYLLHMQFTVNLQEQTGSCVMHSAVSRGIDILTRVSEEFPGIVDAHLLLAHAQYALGQTEAASRAVNMALHCDNRSAPAHLLSSRLALSKGNSRGANAALHEATASDFQIRKTPAFGLVKAKLCALDGDLETALQTLQSATEFPGVRDESSTGAPGTMFVSERVDVFLDLSEVLSELSRFSEAANVLAEAQERFRGTSEEIRILVASSMLALKRNDFETAMHMLNAVPHSSPMYIQVQEHKATIHLSIRHDKHAFVQCYQDLVDFSPSARSYEQLGAAYMHIQAPEAAVAAYENAHNLNPREASLAIKIGQALVSTHDYLRATDYYVTALQAHADDIRLRHDLAKLFVKLKRYGAAIQLLRYVLEPISVSTNVRKVIQDVQSLLLLAHVCSCAGESNRDDGREGGAFFAAEQSVSQPLLKARELQQIVLDRLHSALETSEVVARQKQIMVDVCCKLASCFLKDKLVTKAIGAYEEALKIDNVNETCTFEIARLWRQQNNLGKCEEQCMVLMRLNSCHDKCAMLLADLQFQKLNHEAAATKLHQVLERNPSDYSALSKLIMFLSRSGRLGDAQRFIELAEQSDSRALSHPGLGFCKGICLVYSNDVIPAINQFNFARTNYKWGPLAIIKMIELYLNPDSNLWEDSQGGECNFPNRAIVNVLLEQLRAFDLQDRLELKVQILEAYTYLAIRSKTKIDQAMQIFINILEAEKDYLPALLGMSTAFMLEKSTTKARNALKRIAKMTYSHELAEDFERGYLLLAEIYIQKSKFDLSEDLCNRCLKYNLSCGKAWETMGIIREREASYKDAADMYEKAWHLENNASASVGFKLAFNYLKAKRFVEAISICNKILSLYPDYPKIRKEILEKAMEALRP